MSLQITMTELTKEKGKMEKCPVCHQSMMCNEITSKQGIKLQWQNDDGKSHYLFDQATKKVSCRGTQEKISEVQTKIQNEPIKLADIQLDLEMLTRIQGLVSKSTQVLKAIEYYVREDLGDTSPARIGMYVNNIADKLLKVSNLAEILEDIGDKDGT